MYSQNSFDLHRHVGYNQVNCIVFRGKYCNKNDNINSREVKMNNKQRLYEVQISVNGESFLLTKETHSPFIKSDVFALTDYKRTKVTLMGADGMVLHGGKVFFDCKLGSETQVVTQDADHPFKIEKNLVDFTAPAVKEQTFLDKIFGFLKKSTVGVEKFPSSSFICVQNGELYHFIGALNESAHAVYFDVLPQSNQAVCKINSENLSADEDSLLFDIIEIEGTKDFIIDTFFQLVKKLYNREPKTSTPLDVVNVGVEKSGDDNNIAMLKCLEDYTIVCMENEVGDHSISSYIQKSEAPLRKILKNTTEKILPIAVISPLLCEKTAVEYELFSSDLVKNAKGKLVTVEIDGKSFFVFDIFSKSIRGYLTRQIDILFSMGFCGVKFANLEVANISKPNKASGDTASYAFDFLYRHMRDKLSIASGANLNIANGKFDSFVIGKDITKIQAAATEIATSQNLTSWDFSGFENLVAMFDINKKYSMAMPIATPAELLSFDPTIFDLCCACNMLACKSVNISAPTPAAITRAEQFAFLKDADVSEIIKIDNGKYAIIFYFEDNANVCFFNFTKADWIMEDCTVNAFSFNFQE